MKSVLSLFLLQRISGQCAPSSYDENELLILCRENSCFIECVDFSRVPNGPDFVECENGQPKQAFPTKCQEKLSCPLIPSSNNLIVNCDENLRVSLSI